MDERPFFPKHDIDADQPVGNPEQPRHNPDEHSLALQSAAMEAAIKNQGFAMLGSKGEFVKEREERSRDNIHPLPEIHLSVTEFKRAGNHETGKSKISINYSFRSVPEDPLFFHCYRGEIDGVGYMVARIQLYLYSKKVYMATENRPPEPNPVRHSSAVKRGKSGIRGKKRRG